MLMCDVCTRRALFSLANATSFATPAILLNVQSLGHTTSPLRIVYRNNSTLASIKKGHHRKELFNALKKQRKTDTENAIPPTKPLGVRARFAAKNAEAAKTNRLNRLEPEARNKYLERSMKEEARYLVDPLKLAHRVIEILREGQLQEALALVRASEKNNDGKGVESVVSWNHIIDWTMGQGSPDEAWKVFNEVWSFRPSLYS